MKKLISKAIKPNGTHIAKTNSYKFVLVYGDRNLEKWSNKKETLEKHIKFLTKCGWDESGFTILDTEIEIIK